MKPNNNKNNDLYDEFLIRYCKAITKEKLNWQNVEVPEVTPAIDIGIKVRAADINKINLTLRSFMHINRNRPKKQKIKEEIIVNRRGAMLGSLKESSTNVKAKFKLSNNKTKPN